MKDTANAQKEIPQIEYHPRQEDFANRINELMLNINNFIRQYGLISEIREKNDGKEVILVFSDEENKKIGKVSFNPNEVNDFTRVKEESEEIVKNYISFRDLEKDLSILVDEKDLQIEVEENSGEKRIRLLNGKVSLYFEVLKYPSEIDKIKELKVKVASIQEDFKETKKLIQEIEDRMTEAGFSFEYTEGKWIRIYDSEKKNKDSQIMFISLNNENLLSEERIEQIRNDVLVLISNMYGYRTFIEDIEELFDGRNIRYETDKKRLIIRDENKKVIYYKSFKRYPLDLLEIQNMRAEVEERIEGYDQFQELRSELEGICGDRGFTLKININLGIITINIKDRNNRSIYYESLEDYPPGIEEMDKVKAEVEEQIKKHDKFMILVSKLEAVCGDRGLTLKININLGIITINIKDRNNRSIYYESLEDYPPGIEEMDKVKAEVEEQIKKHDKFMILVSKLEAVCGDRGLTLKININLGNATINIKDGNNKSIYYESFKKYPPEIAELQKIVDELKGKLVKYPKVNGK